MAPTPTGRKARRLNNRLAGLRAQGDAGNGRERVQRRYFAGGAAAGAAWSKAGGRTWVVWPARRRRQTAVVVWQELGAVKA